MRNTVSVVVALALASIAVTGAFVHRVPLIAPSRCGAASRSSSASLASTTASTIDVGSALDYVSSPQLLEFREPRTNVTVILVGAMHYNPTSVRLAEDAVVDVATRGRLGSVVVESCDLRWNTTGAADRNLVTDFLSNEMRAARDAAGAFGRPVVLGDQRINVTVEALRAGLKEVVSDLVDPPQGWSRLWREVSGAAEVALPSGAGYLGPFSFFEKRLLLAAPVSFIKYPLSFLFRGSPLVTAVLLTLVSLDATSGGSGAAAVATADPAANAMGWGDALGSVGFAALETIVFARLLLKELLVERNEILARNILEQCRIYARGRANVVGGANDDLPRFVSNLLAKVRRPYAPRGEIVYATDVDNDDFVLTDGLRDRISAVRSSSATTTTTENRDDKVVIAVLGMAHCNGIMKLLKDQKV